MAVSAQVVRAQSDGDYPFRAADPSASPRLAKLRGDIQEKGAAAVEPFWEELRVTGAPLIESIPGDKKHSLITFVWRGSADARNVVITDGVSIGVGETR